jgi:adenosylcobinamide amidohydrolase
MVRTATVVPDNERWVHEAKASADLSAALDCALSHPATGENTDEIMKRLKD